MELSELKRKATYYGNILLEQRVHKRGECPTMELLPNQDITYYFDENMVEIGYYTKATKQVQLTHGRKWDNTFFSGLQIKKL